MYDRLGKCNVLLPRVPNRVTGRDLLPDTKFAPLKNIFLLSICYPLNKMG